MRRPSRRAFLATLAGAAVAGTGILYWQRHAWMGGEHAAHPDHAAHTDTITHDFVNPLRLPGREGMFAAIDAADVREITVAPLDYDVLPGISSPLWAYVVETGGRRLINPILRARRGDEVRLVMANRLPQPTIIHWHGLTNDERNDGTGRFWAAPGERFNYGFMVRDRAATYWYHPHPHGNAGEQVARGLTSLFLVEDDEDAALSRALDLAFGTTDVPLIVGDRAFDHEGRLDYPTSSEEKFHGFFGGEVLVNLTARPYFDAQRRIYRFRILNASNARAYRLAFAQGEKLFDYHLIGTDGGLLAEPATVREAFVAPAQRLDVLVDLRQAQGEEPVLMKSLAFDPMHNENDGGPAADGAHAGHAAADPHAGHGGGLADGAEIPLMRINVEAGGDYQRKIPSRLSQLPLLSDAYTAERRFLLAHDGGGNWTINGWRFAMRAVPVTVARGTREIWSIENARASMPHPMHVHGFQARVVERRSSPEQVRTAAAPDGLLPQDRGLLDTVLVWPGETVRIALDFTHPFPGDQIYVFHCHNLEHEDTGMMINYRVTV
jgi:blue copper oxidase